MAKSKSLNIYTRSIKNLARNTPVRVGIVLAGFILPYMKATAVARLRVYDVIEMFVENPTISVELYLPWRRYDVVIFEKTLTAQALDLARKVKKQGTKIVLDVNVDYFSKGTPRVTDSMQGIANQFARLADAIIAPSERLVEELRKAKVHDYIKYIPEPLPDRYFAHPKKEFAKVPRLIWCGYQEKAYELMEIKEQIRTVREKFGATLTLISDGDPYIDEISAYDFIPYREKSITSDLATGDVFIAPRRFDQSYKYHHTFSKIGLPMAIGLPVFASPIPSYLKSPAVLCATHEDWDNAFTDLYTGQIDLSDLSKRGREYCKKEFSWERGELYYENLFKSLIKK